MIVMKSYTLGSLKRIRKSDGITINWASDTVNIPTVQYCPKMSGNQGLDNKTYHNKTGKRMPTKGVKTMQIIMPPRTHWNQFAE